MAAAAVLMLPLWSAWMKALSAKPHYEFFPILMVGIIFLTRQRLLSVDQSSLRPGHPMVSLAMGIISVPFLLVGCFQPSTLFAFIGTISAFSMVLNSIGGWALIRTISPIFVLVALITPPPGELDTLLTLRLQRLSVIIASRTLDMFGIFHVVNMNTLEVDGQRFLVEEACSGIQSLFSILAFAVFYAIWNYRGIFRTALLLFGAVLFDLTLNVFRICLGVIAKVTGDIDLLSGTPHEILGIIVFILGLLLTLSWEFVLEEVYHSSTASAGKLRMIFRRIFSGKKKPLNSGKGQPQTIVTTAVNSSATAGEKSSLSSKSKTLSKPVRKVFVGALAAWVVMVLPLSALASVRILREQMRQSTAKKDDRVQEALASKGEERLKKLEELTQKTRASFTPPLQIGDWKLLPESVQSSQRTLSFGSKSESFAYLNGNRQILVSIDYPFYGYHDLNICYDMGGWKVNVLPAESTGSTPELPYNVSALSRGVDQKGLLVYSAFLVDGNWKIEPPEARYEMESGNSGGFTGNLIKRGVYRLNKMFTDIPAMLKNASKPEVDSYYENFQLQALVVGTDNPSQADRDAVQNFFRQAAPELKLKFMEAKGSAGNSSEKSTAK
ncbi:MAG: exosortase U [bacterium]